MNESQSLAVGLAVGVPSLLIISVTFIFWLKQQRSLKKEDLEDSRSLDQDVTFDNLGDFQNSDSTLIKSIPKTHENSDVNSISTDSDPSNLKGPSIPLTTIENNSSNSSRRLDTSNTSTNSQTPNRHTLGQNQTHPSYDFYETMFPNLPSVTERNSVDNYAKRISTPFFEKLPSGPNIAVANSSQVNSMHSTPFGSRRNSELMKSDSINNLRRSEFESDSKISSKLNSTESIEVLSKTTANKIDPPITHMSATDLSQTHRLSSPFEDDFKDLDNESDDEIDPNQKGVHPYSNLVD